jgi:hypothetical protein
MGAAALIALCCPVVSAREKAHPVSKSTWGGDHVIMEVAENGAQLEFDCAAGQITGPLMVDANGNFDVHGTFAAEHPGPTTREDDSRAAAHYSGHIEGDTMTLKIVRDKEEIGPFTLTRGRQSILRKCR